MGKINEKRLVLFKSFSYIYRVMRVQPLNDKRKMKKVNVFKTTFPTGETHYGVSEQVHTVESYLSKTKSISITKTKKGLHISKFQSDIVEFENYVIIELVSTFDDSKDAKVKRDELIKLDRNSINNISANTISKLDYKVNEINLPLEKSKSMTSKDGNKIYFVELGYAKLKGILDKVNLNSKHPLLPNFVMVNEGSYKIVRA
jgi:hypothetical protein